MSGRRAAVAAILLLAMTGVAAVAYATVEGVGTSPDSVAYLRAADRLVEGQPTGGQYPPFYSALLAATRLIGLEPLAAARWLNALLLGANIALVGFALLWSFPRKAWPGVIGALLMLVSPALVGTHAMAWTEPLFLFLSLLSLLTLTHYLETSGLLWLIGSGGLAALALLTRYLGVALLVTGGVGILLLAHAPRGRRVRDAVLWSLIVGLPLVLWLAGVQVGTNRELGFHPPTVAYFWEAFITTSGWLGAPGSTSKGIRVALLSLIALWGAAVLYRRRRFCSNSGSIPSFLQLMVIFVAVYLAVLGLSITFLDANTPLDDRILLPILVGGFFGVTFLADETLRSFSSPARPAVVLMGVAVVSLIFAAGQTLGLLDFRHREGFGFADKRWRQSETLALVRNLPAGISLYSNGPEAIYLNTGRDARPFPRLDAAMNGQVNQAYGDELRVMADQLTRSGGVVVYFRSMPRRTIPSEATLREDLGLRLAVEAVDGALYVAAGAP